MRVRKGRLSTLAARILGEPSRPASSPEGSTIQSPKVTTAAPPMARIRKNCISRSEGWRSGVVSRSNTETGATSIRFFRVACRMSVRFGAAFITQHFSVYSAVEGAPLGYFHLIHQRRQTAYRCRLGRPFLSLDKHTAEAGIYQVK